ncbi:MAG: 2-phosphosulfolactate phosphatase [Blastocatellia bacterium]
MCFSHLEGSLAPEARAAVAAYLSVKSDLKQTLRQCGSGRELIERGFERDVELASETDISDCAPILVNNAYVNRSI